MSTYVIGDIQGCYQELSALLELIKFDQTEDQLWFVGDLVNRGSESLAVLKLVKQLSSNVVLGNHEFHLLAVAAGIRSSQASDTLAEILESEECDELLAWLRHRPLLHYDQDHNIVMTHAGLFPGWTLTQAQQLAEQVSLQLKKDDYANFLQTLYRKQIVCWNENLTPVEQMCFAVNAFTRMRYCDADSCLDLSAVGPVGSESADLQPWFTMPAKYPEDLTIVFGHWAALLGETNRKNIFAVDTGCVWGCQLTALRLEDKKKFMVDKIK